MSSGETDLFCGVILQAMRDYNCRLRGEIPKAGTIQDGIEAERFLTDTHGPWKRSRMDICHAAGMCPDALRDRILAAKAKAGDLSTLMPSDVRHPQRRKADLFEEIL